MCLIAIALDRLRAGELPAHILQTIFGSGAKVPKNRLQSQFRVAMGFKILTVYPDTFSYFVQRENTYYGVD